MSTQQIGGRDWRNDFDMDDPQFGDLYNEICDDLVAHCPVARSQVGEGYVVISRYGDILEELKDWETFSSADGIIGANRPPDQPFFKPNETDPPEHEQLRGALSKFFTPKAVAAHEPEIRGIANGLIDRMLARSGGTLEVVSEYADPLPPIAFCQVVANMPPEDMDFLQQVFTDAITGPHDDRGANWLKGQNYLSDYLQKRADMPRQDDIVDTVLHYEFPDGSPYTHDDRAGTLAQVVAAGATTTGAVISGALYHLATHPDDRELLANDRSRLPRAVEEFLRFYVSAPCNGRRVMRDVEVAGTKLRGPQEDTKGEYVIYNLGGANRDPSVFDNPGEVDVERSPNQHLSFAGGVHRCIGLHLARLNIRVAVDTFLDRVPEFSVAEGFEPHFQGGITRSLVSVPLVFDATATK
jgi:cytochrome P450